MESGNDARTEAQIRYLYQSVESLRRAAQAIPVRTIGFLAICLIFQFYYYINTPVGMNAGAAFFYVVFWGMFLVVALASRVRLHELRLLGTLFFASFGFMVCWALSLFLWGYLWGVDFPQVSQVSMWGIIAMQVLYVAMSEEFVFRYALPQILMAKFKSWVALLIPQFTFAIYHMAAYQGDVTSIVIAFIFGCLMMAAYGIRIRSPIPKKWLGSRWGLGFCIGCHASYNLVILGILSGGITAVGG
jgi:membrane protease YdiL (CAAX protease family)